MERIKIINFAGLHDVEIELNQVNIFIGKQASGKSVTAKLIYFFKSIPKEIGKLIFEKASTKEINTSLKEQFLTYFPYGTWPSGSFSIQYFYSHEYCIIARDEKSKLKLSFSDHASKIFGAGKRLSAKQTIILNESEYIESFRMRMVFEAKFNVLSKNYFGISSLSNTTFVPAGRSFFANLQSSIFSFLSSNNSLDPFLIQFGSTYESMKSYLLGPSKQRMKKEKSIALGICEEIMGGSYHQEKDNDYLIHKDKRKVNVAFTSSGQQETLPLLLILQAYETRIFRGSGSTLFIEEPEAHLFPEAQKKIVELIAYIIQKTHPHIQLIITTHSPYILSAFNTILEASKISKNEKIDSDSLYKILPKHFIFDYEAMNAFSMEKGRAKSIIDEESGLVDAEYLDSVSIEIANQFDQLLDLF